MFMVDCAAASSLLWIHCDLVGFAPELIETFRKLAKESLALNTDQILLSATHTHAGESCASVYVAADPQQSHCQQVPVQYTFKRRAHMTWVSASF